MDNQLKERLAEHLRNCNRAYQEFTNSSRGAIIKYFNNLSVPGANKDACSRRLQTDFRYLIVKYRENLGKINLKLDEETMKLHLAQMDIFMESFHQKDQ